MWKCSWLFHLKLIPPVWKIYSKSATGGGLIFNALACCGKDKLLHYSNQKYTTLVESSSFVPMGQWPVSHVYLQNYSFFVLPKQNELWELETHFKHFIKFIWSFWIKTNMYNRQTRENMHRFFDNYLEWYVVRHCGVNWKFYATLKCVGVLT